LISFIKFIVNERNVKYIILYCVWELLWFHFIKVPVPLWSLIKLLFRFSGFATAKSYGSHWLLDPVFSAEGENNYCNVCNKCCGSRSGSYQLSFWARWISVREKNYRIKNQNKIRTKKKKTVHFTPSCKSCQLASLKMLP
jgi:hypothetical protein